MAGNRLSWSQNLLVITADTSVDDSSFAPEEWWSLPPSTLKAYLVVALETVSGTGRTAIRITTSSPLPGTIDTNWTIEYVGYQGSAPTPLLWNQIPLTDNVINNLLENPLPSASYRFRLVAREAGKSPNYFPEVTITTPADTDWTNLNAIFNDDILSKNEKPEVMRTYDDIIQEQSGLDAIAVLWSITTEKTNYDTAITNLTSSLTALSPAWNLLTADTPLGTGGGATLRAKFSSVASTRSILKQKIDTLTKSSIDDIGFDGILSKGEKLQIIVRFNLAIADTNALSNKAKALGVSYTNLTSAFGSLQGYLRGLDSATYSAYLAAGGMANEAHFDTGIDTTISPSVWSSTWNSYDTERAKLAVSLQGVTRTIAAAMGFSGSTGQTGRNVVITGTSTTAFDGYTVVDNDTIILGNQTTYSENGIYSITVAGGSVAAAKTYPSAGTLQATGTYINDSSSRDNNSFTYATLTAPDSALDSASTASVIYSGWSSTQTSGTLTVESNWTISDNGAAHGAGNIYYSIDGGSTWTLFGSGTFSSSYQGAHTVTVALTGVDQSLLRVRVDALAGTRFTKAWNSIDMIWDFTYYHGSSVSQIKEVYFDATALGAGTVSLTKLADLSDGETYLIAHGTNWGSKSITINRPTVNGEITFTASTPSYQLPLASLYSGATAKVLSNTSGVLSFVDPASSGSVAWGSVTGTLSSQTDLNSALVLRESYDLSCSVSGSPTASQKVLIFPAVRAFQVASTGHGAKVYTNPSATADFICAKNGTTFGTLRISTAGALSLISFTATSFAVGDILTITAPSSADSTMADIGITLSAKVV